MELPTDVLGMVHEYSKPLFRFRNDYAKVVQMLEQEWPELYTKLSGPDADRVGGCLKAYIAAYGDYIQMEDDFEKLKSDWGQACVPNTDTVRTYAYWDKYGWYKDECHRTMIHEMVLFDELQVLVAE